MITGVCNLQWYRFEVMPGYGIQMIHPALLRLTSQHREYTWNSEKSENLYKTFLEPVEPEKQGFRSNRDRQDDEY